MPDQEPLPSIKTPWESGTPGSSSAAGRGEGSPIPVPDHTLIRRIGKGSYGEVWLAKNALGLYRAVKIVHRASFDHDRPFEREFAGIQRFEPVSRRHESQLNILHVGRGPDYFYYVMELADDMGRGPAIDEASYSPRTLRSEILLRGRLAVDECIRLGLALTTALEHLHRHGLVHRDIKPSNIVFVNGIPKLADIGLVAQAEATMSFVGTEGYLPPEGPGTPQADLFSLGKVLYEIGTGHDRQQFPELPTNVVELPDRGALAELNEVLVRACAPEVRHRYQSAAEMHADLALLHSGKSVARIRAVERRLRFVSRAGAAVTALAVLVGAGWLWQTRQTHLVRELAAEKTRLAETNQYWVKIQEQQLVRANSANGVLRLDAEDPAAALPWFVEALAHVERSDLKETEMQRLRLGTLLRYYPRLLGVTRHPAAVHSLAFSPDGRWFAAGSDDGRVLVLTVQTSAVLRSITHTGAVHSVEFSPDNQSLLTACEDGFARVWRIESTNGPVLLPHRGPVRHATFSRDGALIVTASTDKTARIWQASDGHPVGRVLEHSMPLFHACFSPDGSQIATGSGLATYAGEFTLWDPRTGDRVAPAVALTAPATWTAFSPDGSRAASSCGEARFGLLVSRPGVLVDTKTGKVIRKLEHLDRITHVEFSPDGKRLAVSALGYEVLVDDAHTGESLVSPLKHARWVHEAVFSPDGRWVASASSDGTARVWDAATGVPITPPLEHPGEVFCVAFDPTGARLATAGDGGLIYLWDIAHCRPSLPSFWHTPGAISAQVTPDDKLIETHPEGHSGGGGGFRVGAQSPSDADEPVLIWDRFTGRRLYALVVPGGFTIATPPISAAGDLLALGASDGRLRIWNLRSGQLLWQPVALKAPSEAKAFSHDGKYLVVAAQGDQPGSWDARVWSATDGKPFTSILHHTNRVMDAVFGPDDQTLATGGADGLVRIWRVSSGDLIRTIAVCTTGVNSVRFSHDGRRLLTADLSNKTASLWDTGSGSLVFPPLRHSGIVWGAEFDPFERRILTASFDMSAAQWDAQTGERIDPLMMHHRGLNSASYDGTGRLICTSSVDQTVRLWSSETGELLAAPFHHSATTLTAQLTKDGQALLTAGTEGRAQLWDLAVTTWSVDDLRRYAEALSTRRLKPNGQLQALSADAIATRIGELRASRPRDFELLSNELDSWHRREKVDARRAGNNFAAAFHAQRTTLPDLD